MSEVDLPRVTAVLQSILSHLEQPDVDVLWAGFEPLAEAIDEVVEQIQRLERGDTSEVNYLRFHFLPTSSLQEFAISNDWGDEYLQLAAEFDAAIAGSE